MILLFEKKRDAVNKEEIKQFLNQVNILFNPSVNPEPSAIAEQSTNKEEQIVRTYLYVIM